MSESFRDVAVESVPESVGFLLSQDLMFISKVTGTAAALGLRVEVIGSIDQLSIRCGTIEPRAVFLDLNCPAFGPGAVTSQWDGRRKPHVIAFGSHVDTERLDLALKAGCNEVLPRSRFSATLPELLRRTLAAGN